MGLTFLAFVLSNSDCQTSFKLSPNENPADASITNGVPFSCSGLYASYGTISCTSSFLMGFTRSSRFTPRYMAIAAATNTDE